MTMYWASGSMNLWSWDAGDHDDGGRGRSIDLTEGTCSHLPSVREMLQYLVNLNMNWIIDLCPIWGLLGEELHIWVSNYLIRHCSCYNKLFSQTFWKVNFCSSLFTPWDVLKIIFGHPRPQKFPIKGWPFCFLVHKHFNFSSPSSSIPIPYPLST